MVNYLSYFVPEQSSHRTPVQPLVKTNTDFIWLKSHTEAFKRIKNAILKWLPLQFYDVSHPLLIECDASKKGLDCIFLKPMDKNITYQDISDFSEKEMEEFLKHLRSVSYSSKSLSDAETQYWTLEEKLLGVVFGIEHFKHFTSGRKAHIITDHKSLLPLFQKFLTNTMPHLLKLLLHVSAYDVILHYQPGSRRKLSDSLSRQSNHSTDAGSKTEIKGLNISIHEVDTNISEWKLINIREETQKNDTMQILIRHILEGWPKIQESGQIMSRNFIHFIMIVCDWWIGFKRNQ